MRKNNYRLTKPSDIRILLANTINEYINGEITDTKAKTVGYLGGQMLKVMETCDLEKRIEELEKTVEKE